MSLINDTIYNFLFLKHSIADDEQSILPITNIETGVVTFPNSSKGLFINAGSLILSTNNESPIITDIITGFINAFVENE